MHFLYVHRTRATGVEAVHIGQIMLGLRKLGHDVSMLSPVGDYIEGISQPATQSPAGQGAAPVKTASKRSFEMPELLFECLELGFNLKAFIDGMRLSAKRNVDGIYERYSIFGLAGLLLSKWRRVPLVLEVNYTSLSPLVRKRSPLLKPLARWLDGVLFRSATHLLAVSSYLKDELVREFRVDPAAITVVPNAADPAVFDPSLGIAAQPATPLPSGPIVGFVGGFYKWHGLDLLVEAFLKVAVRHPDAALLLIGDGPMRAEVEAQVEARGLGGRVLMPGKVHHTRLAPYVARFGVGVMPDSNLYGSPMKIFEYMSMAVPVVAPDYGPLRDVLVDGQQGRIFRRRDVDHLAECISDLLADAALRRRMGEAARRSVIDTHNWLNNSKVALMHLTSRSTQAC